MAATISSKFLAQHWWEICRAVTPARHSVSLRDHDRQVDARESHGPKSPLNIARKIEPQIGGRSMQWGFALITIALAGCASSANEITPTYISPLQYQHLSCPQIQAEVARVSHRASQLAGVQDEKATNDAVATGVGVVLFWPALFFMKGDGSTAAELGRLRGEFEALEKMSVEKGCGLVFRTREPVEEYK